MSGRGAGAADNKRSPHARASGRVLAVLIGCWTVLLLGGCGSSTGPAHTSAGSTAQLNSVPSGGIKAAGTPRYAAPPSSAPVQRGVVQIAYRNYAIDPDTLRVKLGSTLRWTNYDQAPHNVTSTSGPQHIASGNLGEDAAFEIKLEKPGIVHYSPPRPPRP